MSICVRRLANLTPQTISALQQRLNEYYSHPPEIYYTIADQAAANYNAFSQPFHCDLIARVKSGMTVLELGCGSAHLCPFIESAGASYTGMDHSAQLLENNRNRFPNATFLPVTANPSTQFNLVASLYTIEHVADPPAYLERMWSFCEPGGLIAIICPEFVENSDIPPSIYLGKTPARFRHKLAVLEFVDAFQHLLDLYVRAPRWKTKAQAASAGAFWINLKPRILCGASYSIDADAVHLPRLKDLIFWLQGRGASIVTTSEMMRNIDPAVLRYNCYVAARKPGLER